MRVTSVVKVVPSAPLHLAHIFNTGRIGDMGNLSDQQRADTYIGIETPEISAAVADAHVRIQFHWDTVPNPLIRTHAMPAIGFLTFHITREIAAFDPENAELHRSTHQDYLKTLKQCCNGLFDYFKYSLQNPFIRPFNAGCIENWSWSDEAGNALHTQPKLNLMAPFPGYPFAFGQPGHGSRPLVRSQEAALISTIQGRTEFRVEDQLRAQAQEAMFEENLRLAVLLLAVSTEVAIKKAFFQTGTAAGEAFDFLQENRHVEVSPIELIHKVAKHAFGESFHDKHPDAYLSVKHLFQCRNKVAHKGTATFRGPRELLVALDLQRLHTWWQDSAKLIDWLRQLSVS